MFNKKILHIIPESIKDIEKSNYGNAKDIRARTQYFIEKKIEFDELYVKERTDECLMKSLVAMDISKYKCVFIEYPLYPNSLKFLKEKNPNLKLIVRSHNAEFFHKLHYALGCIINTHEYKKAFNFLKLAFKHLRLDYLCGKYADYILTITEWEKENYWENLIFFIKNKKKIKYLPYYLPDKYFVKIPENKNKKNICVCLLSPAKGARPLLLGSAKKFIKIVSNLENNKNWKFIITGGKHIYDNIHIPNNIEKLEKINNIYELLSESKAIVITSDLGFGFKTRIVEAISCKNYILISKKLFNRLPLEIQPYCICLKNDTKKAFNSALEKCFNNYPNQDLNEKMKNKAFLVLESIL